MGPHERSALEREHRELSNTVAKTQIQGRRLDEIEKLLGIDSPTSKALRDYFRPHVPPKV